MDRDAFLDAVRSAPAGHLTVLIAVFVGLTAGVVFAAWGVAGVVTESVLTRPFVTIGVLVLFERFRVSLAS
ncbi:hypothetical protein DJ70_07995 [Halorubrum halodurans]|uniref:Uncharacterized protein n=1 Tax=Halorubrum halodurans TaxID=1383851 RepID=A0A256IKG4_9EURY|nr:hypothetical protein DJ70_07995 [Halorubrum halodurans]